MLTTLDTKESSRGAMQNLRTVDSNRSDEISILKHLREIARISAILQFFASIVYLFGSAFLSKSESFVIGSSILAIGISSLPVIYAIVHRKFVLLFSCISIYNLSPIWFLYLESITPGYDAYEYSQPIFKMEALFWIAIFQLCVNLLYFAYWKRGMGGSIKFFSFLNAVRLPSTFYVKLTIFSFAAPLIFFSFVYGSAEVVWSTLAAGRSGGGGVLLRQESVGDSTSAMLPVVWLWELTPVFGAISYFTAAKRNSLLPFLGIVLGLLVIFALFLSGNRSVMMYAAAPVLFFFFYFNWSRGLKFWLTAVVLLFAVIGVMELQQRFRGNLLEVISDPVNAAKNQGYKSITTFDPTQSQRDNNMYLLCLAIKGYPNKYEFEGFGNFTAILLNPIPRSIWPSKPILYFAKDLAYQQPFVLDGPLFMGTTSLSYSVVGEAYQTKGLIGIIVYAITYAIFLLLFDGVIYYTKDKNGITLGILGMNIFLAFWGFRSLFALITFLYPLILLVFIVKLIARGKMKAGRMIPA